MTSQTGPLLFYGIFDALRKAGFPLSVRDYLDGLMALTYYREPFIDLKDVQPIVTDANDVMSGMRDKPLHRIRLRNELVWLCETLWARSDDEREVVREVITRKIGPPPAQWIEKRLKLDQVTPANIRSADLPPTTPSQQKEREEEKKRQDQIRRKKTEEKQEANKDGTEGGGEGQGPPDPDKPDSSPVELADDGDVSIPELDVPVLDEGKFVLSGTQLVSSLWLTALWRRLFVPIRRPDLREIDPIETVRMASCTGRIVRPAMRMMRVNDASLLVLIDVGYGMAPWFDFIESLVESIEVNKYRVGTISTAFFTGAPGPSVYASRNLSRPIGLVKLLREMSSSPLLVFGQAGVLGSTQSHLSDRLDDFFSEVAANDLKPLVWINPMPQKRWRDSEMPRILAEPNTFAFNLNSESLLRAVDVLRGVL